MLKVATVFSGIGAAEQALKQLGVKHKIVFACDNGERYLDIDEKEIKKELENVEKNEKENYIKNLYDETGKKNNVKVSYFANYNIGEDQWFEDVRFIDGKQYYNKVDLFIGGSPCQSFSTYGKRLGLEDTRGTLFYDYARLIGEIQPKVFIFENVTGLLNHNKGETWKTIKRVFSDLNYHISDSILNAQDYGLPQMRKRVFVVGIKDDLSSSKLVFSKGKKLDIFAEDLLDKEVPNKYYLPFKGFRYVTEHKRNEGRARVNRDVIGCQTANQQFNWTGDFRVESPKKEHYEDKRIYIGEYFGEAAVARKLTPQECLRLMGFKDFEIKVPDQVLYRQVGNSIAVPVLKSILKDILNQFKL